MDATKIVVQLFDAENKILPLTGFSIKLSYADANNVVVLDKPKHYKTGVNGKVTIELLPSKNYYHLEYYLRGSRIPRMFKFLVPESTQVLNIEDLIVVDQVDNPDTANLLAELRALRDACQVFLDDYPNLKISLDVLDRKVEDLRTLASAQANDIAAIQTAMAQVQLAYQSVLLQLSDLDKLKADKYHVTELNRLVNARIDYLDGSLKLLEERVVSNADDFLKFKLWLLNELSALKEFAKNEDAKLRKLIEDYIRDVAALLQAEIDSLKSKIQNLETESGEHLIMYQELKASTDNSYAGISNKFEVVAKENFAMAKRIEITEASVGNNTARIEDTITAMATDKMAMTERIESMQVVVDGNTAGIKDTTKALATAELALTQRIEMAESRVDDNTALIQDTSNTMATANKAMTDRIEIAESKVADNTASIKHIESTYADETTVIAKVENSLKATFSKDINDAVGKIQVGGRNLLNDSHDEREKLVTSTKPSSLEVYLIDGGTLAPSTIYTLSGYILIGSNTKNVELLFKNDKYLTEDKSFVFKPEAGKYVFFKHTFTTGINTDQQGRILITHQGSSDATSSIIRTKLVKLELGTMATDWTPSLTDGEEKFLYVNAQIDSMKLVQATDKQAITQEIDNAVSEINNNKASITELKSTSATKDQVVSMAREALTAEWTNYTDTVAGNMVIGGRNYLDDSLFDKGYWVFTGTTGYTALAKAERLSIYSNNKTGSGLWALSSLKSKSLANLVSNAKVTLSFTGFGSNGSGFGLLYFRLRVRRGTAWTTNVNTLFNVLDDDNVRYKKTFFVGSLESADEISAEFYFANQVGELWISKAQMELGDKATDWTVAPSDYLEDIRITKASLEEYKTVSADANKALAERVTKAETQVNDSKGKISIIESSVSTLSNTVTTMNTTMDSGFKNSNAKYESLASTVSSNQSSTATSLTSLSTRIDNLNPNMIKLADMVDGHVSNTNGSFISGSGHKATAFLEVFESVVYMLRSTYTSTGNFRVVWYDGSKAYISGALYPTLTAAKTLTAPAGAAYVRLSMAPAPVPLTSFIEMTASAVGAISAELSDFKDAQAKQNGAFANSISKNETAIGNNTTTLNTFANTYATKDAVGGLAKTALQSTWQADAQAKVDALYVGGRNLAKLSDTPISSLTYHLGTYFLTDASLVQGEKVTLTIWGDLSPDATHFMLYNSGGSVQLVTDIKTKVNGVYTATFTWRIAPNNNYVNLYAAPNAARTHPTVVEKIMLERGSVSSAWSPALIDLNATVIKNTADITSVSKTLSDTTKSTAETINTLSTTVTKNQADVTGKLDSLYIGGRNYFLNSKLNRATAVTTAWINSIVVTAPDALTNYSGNMCLSAEFLFPTATTGTIKVWIQLGGGGLTTALNIYNDISVPIGTVGVYKVEGTIAVPKLTAAQVVAHVRVSGTAYSGLILQNMKLEKGNKASDWSIAPEDIEVVTSKSTADIATINKAVSNLSNATSESFTSMSSTISEQKTELLDKLSGYTENKVGVVPNPVGGVYSGPSSATGAIQIILPMKPTGVMVKFTVDIYNYASNTSQSYEIGGYSYLPANSWLQTTASCTGAANRTLPVRFGIAANDNACIWIGEVNTAWAHTKVRVRDFFASYGEEYHKHTYWNKGWFITIVSAFNTVHATIQPFNGEKAASDVSASLDNYKTTQVTLTDAMTLDINKANSVASNAFALATTTEATVAKQGVAITSMDTRLVASIADINKTVSLLPGGDMVNPDAWYSHYTGTDISRNFIPVASSPIGTAYRSGTGNDFNYSTTEIIIETGRKYKLSAWFFKTSTANGTFGFTFKRAGSKVDYGSISLTPRLTNGWSFQEVIYDGAFFGDYKIKPGFFINHAGTDGYGCITAYKFEDITDVYLLESKAEANWSVTTEAIAGGKYAVAGINLGVNGVTQQSEFIVKASKFLIADSAGITKAAFLNNGLNPEMVIDGSIAANKVRIGTGANLIPDPFWEAGLSGMWLPGNNVAAITLLNRANSMLVSTCPSTRVVRYASNSTTVAVVASMFSHIEPYTKEDGGIPVVADEQYKISLDLIKAYSPVTTGTVEIRVYYYLQTGQSTYAIPISISLASYSSGWKNNSATFAVPANAVKMRVFVLASNLIGTMEWCNLAVMKMVDGSLVVNGSITGNEIKAGSMWANAFAANTITGNEIKAGSITGKEIQANTITAANVAANTLTGNEIKAGTITGTELKANTVTAANIAANTITGAEIKAGSMYANAFSAGTITGNEIKAGTVSASHLATNSVTADKILGGTITGNKIAANQSITSPVINGGTVTGSTIVGGNLNIGSGVFTVDSQGNVKLTKGQINIANNFIVDTNGNMTAKSGVFGGSVSADSIDTPVSQTYFADVGSYSPVFPPSKHLRRMFITTFSVSVIVPPSWNHDNRGEYSIDIKIYYKSPAGVETLLDRFGGVYKTTGPVGEQYTTYDKPITRTIPNYEVNVPLEGGSYMVDVRTKWKFENSTFTNDNATLGQDEYLRTSERTGTRIGHITRRLMQYNLYRKV